MKWISTYTGFFRNIRLFHFIYNYINRNKLQHNKPLYSKNNINQTVYHSISSKLFKDRTTKLPWLDYPNKENEIINHPKFSSFSKEIQKGILNWYRNGYIILDRYVGDELVAEINQDVEYLLETEVLQFNYTKRKIFDAFKYAPSIKQLVHDKSITDILSFILDKEVFPFQTINFTKGSEQKPHSDWLHMSTFPRGYLVGVWVALEDITIDAGPIAYYPNSHHLPYLSNSDIGAKNNFLFLDKDANNKFEHKIAQEIVAHQLQAKVFEAKKGDVLIWHANLIHEGMPIINNALSRKSMVIHYFAKGVICYHEISERPALIDAK